jgi:hypothetical protein
MAAKAVITPALRSGRLPRRQATRKSAIASSACIVMPWYTAPSTVLSRAMSLGDQTTRKQAASIATSRRSGSTRRTIANRQAAAASTQTA